MQTTADIAFDVANGDDMWTPKHDPKVGSGALIRAARKSVAAPHGFVDDGYADSDDLSRWMDRIEQPHA